jgi:hypothetical protein
LGRFKRWTINCSLDENNQPILIDTMSLYMNSSCQGEPYLQKIYRDNVCVPYTNTEQWSLYKPIYGKNDTIC